MEEHDEHQGHDHAGHDHAAAQGMVDDHSVVAVADHGATGAHTEVPGHHEEHGEQGPILLDGKMFLLFLIVFLLAGAILRKFAWNPILSALDEREKNIRDSIVNAEKIAEEMTALDGKVAERIAEADAQAKETLAQARSGAQDVAKTIEDAARDEAKILLENASREIGAAEKKAVAGLRASSAELAVSLAGKILQSELDEAKSRRLTDRLIAEL